MPTVGSNWGTAPGVVETNIPARNKGGVWVLDSHDPPQRYRSGKRTGYKR